MQLQTMHQKAVQRWRTLQERQAEWIAATHHVTRQELEQSPRSFQEEVHAAWMRYWHAECDAGRGLETED